MHRSLCGGFHQRSPACNLERWVKNCNGRYFLSLFLVVRANQKIRNLALGHESTSRAIETKSPAFSASFYPKRNEQTTANHSTSRQIHSTTQIVTRFRIMSRELVSYLVTREKEKKEKTASMSRPKVAQTQSVLTKVFTNTASESQSQPGSKNKPKYQRQFPM
jgi:hypothetical protein